MHLVLTSYVVILGWVLSLVITLAAGMAILAWLLNWLTGELNVWREIKRKNIAMAIVMGAAILTIGLIIGMLR